MVIKEKTYKLLCEYRFRPDLSYYDVNNQIWKSLFSHDFEHWNTDGRSIRFSNYKNRSVLAIEHDRIVLEWDIPGSVENFKKLFKNALKKYTDKIKVEDYRRLGIRTQTFIPVDFKFNELIEISKEKFLSQDERLLDIVGVSTNDYQYNIVTEKDGYRLQIVCGPVIKEEIPRWYDPAKVSTYKNQEAKEIKYPDVAFYIDCDCSIEEPLSDITEQFLDDALDMVITTPRQIKKYVFGDNL